MRKSIIRGFMVVMLAVLITVFYVSMASATAFDLHNLFTYEAGEWMYREGLVIMAISSHNGYYIFDPTEDPEKLLHSTMWRTEKTHIEEINEFSPNAFMDRFEEWIDLMNQFSILVGEDYETTTVNTEQYEAQIQSGVCRFVALQEDYVSGEMIAETSYTSPDGRNNEASFVWEILPVQLADENGMLCSKDVYLYYRTTESYPDGYCMEMNWLCADQELSGRMLSQIREQISISGNEHGEYRFKMSN